MAEPQLRDNPLLRVLVDVAAAVAERKRAERASKVLKDTARRDF